MKNIIITSVIACMLAAVVFVPTAKAEAGWRDDMLSVLRTLLVQIEELQKRIVLKEEPVTDVDVTEKCNYTWHRDLTIGDHGVDVLKLQIFLNKYSEKTRVSAWGYGAPGNETQYFGNATANAVKRFQDMFDIVESGFGEMTREKVTEECSDTAVDPDPPIDPRPDPVYPEPTEPDPVVPTPASFSLSDVVKVTVASYGSVEVDAGYYLYTIELRSGAKPTLRVYPNGTQEMVEKSLRDIGYTGDVTALMSMAQKGDDFTKVDDFAPTITVLSIDDRSLNILVEASNNANSGVTGCGPLRYGELEWGDGASEVVYGLGCSSVRQDLQVNYMYSKTGEYEVKFTDTKGRSVSKTVNMSKSTYTSYTINDITKVEAKSVDPVPGTVDDEYTLYTIYLKDGSVRTVQVIGFATYQSNAQRFRDSGYNGDIEDIYKHPSL